MQLSADRRANVPREVAFARATDVDTFANAAREAGLQVTHTGDGAVGVGHRWQIKGQLRTVTLDTEAVIEDHAPPEGFAVSAVHRNIHLTFALEFEETAPEKCHVTLDVLAAPQTLGARLLLKSAQLAQSRIEERLYKGLRKAIRRWERDYAAI